MKETKTRVVIRIKIMLRGNRLRISVTNNGMGIEKDRLAELRRQLSKGSESPGRIGLYHTNIRLKLSYGEPYGIAIKSKRGFGTSVSFDIPGAAPPPSTVGKRRIKKAAEKNPGSLEIVENYFPDCFSFSSTLTASALVALAPGAKRLPSRPSTRPSL
ncbi:sensor histidine kinase [Paenibacillus elgii]|uniref:sensor histidine kinase n=1 Tax=Paenibacillus elgii TaxID=189691 RepID=UPI003B434B34